MALDSTLAKTLIDRGSTYRYVRSQDGATDPYKVIEAASDLLKEGMRYITTDAAAFSDGLTKALEDIRKIPPAEFMNVLRAWMGYLANGRALSGVPYPCTPDNLAPLHGKRCWKNYQHWKRAPRVIRQAFTGSYIRPEHVFFYVKEDTGWKLVDVPRTPEGAWDASQYAGKEVCLIRDTPAQVYVKGKVTSSVWSIDNPTIDEMVDACQWLMLATMDSGYLTVGQVAQQTKVTYYDWLRSGADTKQYIQKLFILPLGNTPLTNGPDIVPSNYNIPSIPVIALTRSKDGDKASIFGSFTPQTKYSPQA